MASRVHHWFTKLSFTPNFTSNKKVGSHWYFTANHPFKYYLKPTRFELYQNKYYINNMFQNKKWIFQTFHTILPKVWRRRHGFGSFFRSIHAKANIMIFWNYSQSVVGFLFYVCHVERNRRWPCSLPVRHQCQFLHVIVMVAWAITTLLPLSLTRAFQGNSTSNMWILSSVDLNMLDKDFCRVVETT